MPSPNPNDFDFLDKDEVLPFIKGKIGTNNFEFLQYNDVGQIIFQQDVITQSSPAISNPPKRRIFFIS